MSKPETKIILDTDVISHFISGELITFLPKIFPHQLVVIDIVMKELSKHPRFRPFTLGLVQYGLVKEISIINDRPVFQEYASLSMKFGRGESACMAFCKFHKEILASSNLKDVSTYCKDNGIVLLTTMDFIFEAFDQKKLSLSECDVFISKVLTCGSKLPFPTMEGYLKHMKRG